MNRKNIINIFIGCCLFITGIITGNLITGNDDLDNCKDELIIKQSALIDDLANHLWKDHDCELDIMDSDLVDSIHSLEIKINEYEE